MSKSKEPSRGLGDSIKKVTDLLGIQQCGGCKSRQEAFNKMFPYSRQNRIASRPLTLDEVNFIKSLQSRSSMTAEENRRLFGLYNQLFLTPKHYVQVCSCPRFIMSMIDFISKLVPEQESQGEQQTEE